MTGPSLAQKTCNTSTVHSEPVAELLLTKRPSSAEALGKQPFTTVVFRWSETSLLRLGGQLGVGRDDPQFLLSLQGLLTHLAPALVQIVNALPRIGKRLVHGYLIIPPKSFH